MGKNDGKPARIESGQMRKHLPARGKPDSLPDFGALGAQVARLGDDRGVRPFPCACVIGCSELERSNLRHFDAEFPFRELQMILAGNLTGMAACAVLTVNEQRFHDRSARPRDAPRPR